MRRRRKSVKIKRFSNKMQATLMLVFCIVIILFVALVFRIYSLNTDKGDKYRKKVLSQQTYMNSVIPFKRGDILDRNSSTLASSVRVFNLIIEPKTLLANQEYIDPTFTALSNQFGIKKEDLQAILSSKGTSMYEKVESGKGLSEDNVNSFNEDKKQNDKIKGVWFEESYQRTYPMNTVASDVIGFANSTNIGSYGIEEEYNEQLNGQNGREYGYFDSDLKLDRTVKKAVDGNNIVLSIDANVQKIVEDKIAQFQKDTGSKNMAVMLMNPNNGEILAMASKDPYNLNNPRDLTPFYSADEITAMDENTKTKNLMQLWSNFCISSTYEPGSTFKPFTVAAALEESTTNTSTTYVCNGTTEVSGVRIKCANRTAHGTVTIREALMQSCNVALTQIGAALGRTAFHKYNDLDGFGKKTGIDLPGEETGILHAEKDLNPVELATSSFGQTQNVTMIQMLAGFCSLINGGDYYIPHVVKQIQNEDGAVVKNIDPVVSKKTVSQSTSSTLRDALYDTVESGTATAAKVSGYEICGKTGTAEKHNTDKSNYLVSFLGFTPKEKPQVAIYVVIDEPHVEDQAHSTYATEFASNVLKDVLPFLGVYSK